MPKTRVQVLTNVTKDIFDVEISPRRLPVIIRGSDIGCCVDKWCPGYLARCGGEKMVKVHVCPTGAMDFIHKNFAYK